MAAAPTQAIQTDFGQIARQGVQQVQQAQLMEEQRQERKYQKLQDLEDRYGIPPEDFMLEDTEFRTLNDVQTEAMSGARDRYYDIYKKLEQDPTNINLKKQLSRIKGSVGAIQSTHEKFMKLGEDYLAKLENDEISGVDEDDLMEKLQAVEKGRYKIRWDDNDRLQVLTYDKNGELSDTLNYKELINRDVISKVKVDDDLDKFMERLGEDNLTMAKGGRLVTTNQFGDRQEQAAREHINSIIGTNEASLNDNDALADLLYQATNGETKKREGFTEGDRDTVRTWMMDKIRGRYDNKVTMAADPVYQQQMANERARQSGSGKDTRTGAELIQVATKEGKPQMTSDGSIAFTLGKASKIDATKSDRAVNRIRYNPQTGGVILEAQDRIKLKGIQEMNEIKEKEPDTLFRQMMGDDGQVQYYMIDPVEISSDTETGMKEINTFANYNNIGNADNLISILKQKFQNQFESPEALMEYVNDFKSKENTETQSGGVILDAFGNEIQK